MNKKITMSLLTVSILSTFAFGESMLEKEKVAFTTGIKQALNVIKYENKNTRKFKDGYSVVADVTNSRITAVKLEGLALGVSVSGNITMSNIQALGKGWFIDPQTERAKSAKWVKDVNIKTPTVDTDVNTLSGGNQQKIVLAKLLETGSRIFLMNEPTRGIDVGAKADIYQIMDSLCEAGAGIIMLSSDLPEMLSMADRILVIASGRIHAEFTKQEATQEKLLHAATT